MAMVENVLLIWLDSNFDEKDEDCQNTLTHLRRLINTINIFTDEDECIQFLQENIEDKVCMIISGYIGNHIVPHIHDISQVDSIFIICGTKQYHEKWTRNWSKIKGVYTDMKLICDTLKQSAKERERNALGFSVVAVNDADSSKVNLDRLDPMFMYTQIIKEIFLVIEFEDKHILDLTRYCRKLFETASKYQLAEVDKFEQDYRKQTPIWWYTFESFLYPMLNRALRLSNIEVIIKMGFFIGDLHRQIDELHQQQFINIESKKIFTVYRGQGMPKDEFQKVSQTKGGLIAFNNFLSTSMVEKVSMQFAQCALANADMIGVLFTMKIDSQQSTAPFASVSEVGAYKDQENEVLFAMHTVFRIRDIKQIEDETKRLFRVELELTNDNDEDLQMLTKRIREETCPNEQGWYRVGAVLQKEGKTKQAEKVYQILVQQETDESKHGRLYCRLGDCKDNQAEYKEAIRLYKKSIEIFEKYSPDDADLAATYNNIGEVYRNTNEYASALSYYEKAIRTWRQSLSSNHPNLAMVYNNIGLVYKNLREYASALSYHERALEIQQQSLPPNHPGLGSTYNNMGNLYKNMGEYDKALSYYEKDLEISQQSLPPDHLDLGASYSNIGLLYENMKNYSKACSYYELAVQNGEQSLSSDHPILQSRRNKLDRVKNQLLS